MRNRNPEPKGSCIPRNAVLGPRPAKSGASARCWFRAPRCGGLRSGAGFGAPLLFSGPPKMAPADLPVWKKLLITGNLLAVYVVLLWLEDPDRPLGPVLCVLA